VPTSGPEFDSSIAIYAGAGGGACVLIVIVIVVVVVLRRKNKRHELHHCDVARGVDQHGQPAGGRHVQLQHLRQVVQLSVGPGDAYGNETRDGGGSMMRRRHVCQSGVGLWRRHDDERRRLSDTAAGGFDQQTNGFDPNGGGSFGGDPYGQQTCLRSATGADWNSGGSFDNGQNWNNSGQQW
jgi:hypothetical protein